MHDAKHAAAGYEDAVAVIGMAGRFPGAHTPEDFWRNLRAGVESISFFSVEEMEAAGEAPEWVRNPSYVPAHGIVDGVELFDAAFFGLSPREAEVMDPQVRLFLECAWEAMERAGYESESYEGAVGVFGGAALNNYLMIALRNNPGLASRVGGLQGGIMNQAFLTTWTSYKLDLRGPSVNVQTACSTSLVAIHLAVQSLLSGECSMALAGGSTVQVPQQRGYVWEEGGISSPDGRCRAFDAEAQGTVDGSGTGVVLLKRMEEALADGDVIHAVIRGSAVNNDGSRKAGFTAPGVGGQAAVIAEALALARVEPETIGYVECHGTATPLGDPIEVSALNQVYRARTSRRGYCALGGVKTNLGHLDTAAGVAGFMKAVLSLEHGEIPPSLHFRNPNPEIDFSDSPFFVNAALRTWETSGHPRRAGVSSFGIGGTNAHVILEEAPPRPATGEARPVQALLLSARTATALARATENLAEWLAEHPEAPLADVAYTLQVGRRAFRHRRVLLASNPADALAALREPGTPRALDFTGEPGSRPVAFFFPGGGAPEVGTAAGVYRDEEPFREALDRCADLLRAPLGLDLRELLYPAEGGREEAARLLAGPMVGECALFAVEHAVARLWTAWGVRPEAVLGEGVGEVVAACEAGILSLDDALAFTLARGRLLEARARGTAPEAEMRAVVQRIRAQTASAPALPYLSAASGGVVSPDAVKDPRFWLGLLAEGGRSGEAAHALVSGTERIVLEVGPARGSAERFGDPSRPVLPSLPEEEAPGAAAELLTGALAFLWGSGVRVSWAGVHRGWGRQRLVLPTYPFERQAYWLARPMEGVRRSAAPAASAPAEAPVHDTHDRPELQVEFVAPRNETEERIATAWREIFGIREVGVYDSFYDLGGTSLTAPRLVFRMREALGVDVPLDALYSTPCIADLAERLAPPASGEAAPRRRALDLWDEVTLDPEIAPDPAAGPTPATGKVLLTGATGFLGAYLLHELMSRTGMAVYCLVRAGDAAEGMERIRRKLDSYGIWDEAYRERIFPVPGDLTRPLLGLDPGVFRALAAEVEAVYHNGAQVNHTFPYAALRAANVEGTREVLRLACTGPVKPVQFLSSIAVYAPPAPGSPMPEVIREDDPIDEWRGLTGYAQSKWVAEQVVRIAASRGVPVAVYRPGIVTGDSRSGICSTHDFIWRFTRACVEMEAVPSLDGGTDVAPIDYVAGAIVALSLRPDSLGRTFNLTHPDGVRWGDLWASARRFGYALERIPFSRWASEMLAAAEASEDHPMRPFMAQFVRPPDAPAPPDEGAELPAPRFDCANVVSGLAGSGLGAPPADDRLLHRYFDYFTSIGFLPPPPARVGERAPGEMDALCAS